MDTILRILNGQGDHPTIKLGHARRHIKRGRAYRGDLDGTPNERGECLIFYTMRAAPASFSPSRMVFRRGFPVLPLLPYSAALCHECWLTAKSAVVRFWNDESSF